MSGIKRKYQSGAAKRNKKKKQLEESVKNTSSISSYFSSISSNPNNINDGEEERDDITNSDNDSIQGTNESNVDSAEVNVNEHDVNEENQNNNNLDYTKEYPTDRGLYDGDINDEKLKRAIIEQGPCRPKDEKLFLNMEGKTNFLLCYYHHHIENMEIARTWLCYSPSLRKPYCQVCWLFADRKDLQSRSWIDGVSGDSKNMSSKILKHEKSKSHIAAARAYGQWKTGKTIDEETSKQFELNVSFWTKVLDRLVWIILTMCCLNLAFRGHRETVHDGICEGGNFLGIVALVARYDEVLSELIALPKRATKYLSKKIQEEIIQLLGKTVISSLVSKINRAPFWSIILDTTSDITRVDQLSVVVRWVNVTDKGCESVESFLGFVVVTDADAHGLVNTTMEFLRNLGIDIKKIRGQGYDGASVMSGVRGGVQKLIKDMCDSPIPFVHCASHNLNLVINDAVESLPDNTRFFETMQDIFNFFGKSLKRWRELQEISDNSHVTLKKLCTTRWTSRIDSVRALRDRYVHVLKMLTKLSLLSKNSKERSTAAGLRKRMESFQFIIFIVMWERILRAFNATSTILQSPKMDLSSAARLLNCTMTELQYLRNDWKSVVETATALANSWGIEAVFRRPIDRRSNPEYGIDTEAIFKVNVFYRTIDIAMAELRVRFEGQNSVVKLFSFLHPKQLLKYSNEELKSFTNHLLHTYSLDFTEDLEFEVRAFKTEFAAEIGEKETIGELCDILVGSSLCSSFPNLHKLLVLFLTIPVTVATAERSFSKLKLIKTYLRSKMHQERLYHLSIISIENAEAVALDKKCLVQKFACANATREKRFQS